MQEARPCGAWLFNFQVPVTRLLLIQRPRVPNFAPDLQSLTSNLQSLIPNLQFQTTPSSRNRSTSSGVYPNSSSTSTVCCPSVGGGRR